MLASCLPVVSSYGRHDPGRRSGAFPVGLGSSGQLVPSAGIMAFILFLKSDQMHLHATPAPNYGPTDAVRLARHGFPR
ncbi:hypothetical protein PILCRDRAFT_821907 [Piloderma croceum F 1598]|uniref:Uncharacterized protein n=1 Tax=Piloderma croceum (strain F 1598) TaxID=765440 RepID=A0A0C3F8I6_PILCF|nr:hypothetical protein PILCRDRAFT_821907 [Piloderma croceum F 1598]